MRMPAAFSRSAQPPNSAPASALVMLGSPEPTATRSPRSTPPSIGPAVNRLVSNVCSHPSFAAAAASVTIFIADAGISSLRVSRSYSVSPELSDFTSTPQ